MSSSHRRQSYTYTYERVLYITLQFCVSQVFKRKRAHTQFQAHIHRHSSQRAPPHTYSRTPHTLGTLCDSHMSQAAKPLVCRLLVVMVVPHVTTTQPSTLKGSYDWLDMRASHPVFCSRLRREVKKEVLTKLRSINRTLERRQSDVSEEVEKGSNKGYRRKYDEADNRHRRR